MRFLLSLQFHKSLTTKTKEQAIIYAISTRLRPKLMTAFGAVIALMPLAIGIGIGTNAPTISYRNYWRLYDSSPLLLVILPNTLLNKFYK